MKGGFVLPCYIARVQSLTSLSKAQAPQLTQIKTEQLILVELLRGVGIQSRGYTGIMHQRTPAIWMRKGLFGAKSVED